MSDSKRMSWLAFEIDGLVIESAGPRLPARLGIHSGETWTISPELEFESANEPYSGQLLKRYLERDSVDNAEADLRDFVSLCRVVTLSSFSVKDWVTCSIEDGRVSDWDFGASGERSGSWLPDPLLKLDEVDTLRKLRRPWKSRAPFLDAAIEHFEDAVFTLHPADTVAHSIMAIESTVASRAGQGEHKRDLMTRRAPRLLASQGLGATRSRELLGKFYGTIRTGKAHSDSLAQREAKLVNAARSDGTSPEDIAKEVLRWASESILAMHLRLAAGREVQEIWSELDEHRGP